MSTGHTYFELNCKYYSQISFIKDIDLCLKFCSAKKLVKKFKKPDIYLLEKPSLYSQTTKKTNNNKVKSCKYMPGEKIWLNG